MKLPVLSDLLRYKNSRVLKLYEQNYPKNRLSAEAAFEEMLKYLWLSQKHAMDLARNADDETIPKELFMPRSMQEIDEIWHEFILFTQDYTDFCFHYFGAYQHHLPNVFDNLPRAREEVEKEIEIMLPYIDQHLGEETICNWFHMYLMS